MSNALYLPSTPLNILVCVAHALKHAEQQTAVMLIIDQKEVLNHPYLMSLKEWKESPFVFVEVLPGQAKGLHKLSERKENFFQIRQLVEEYGFDFVATGSDRRVEFQYAMHRCNKQLQKETKTVGLYLDDGLYSYAGRPNHWFKDGLNSVLKKMVYGLWWQEPKTVGASSWVDQAWLFDPVKAFSGLKNQELNRLEAAWFLTPEMHRFVQKFFEVTGFQAQDLISLNEVDLVVLVPHPNNIAKLPGYEKRLEALLTFAKKTGRHTAVKYHPRTSSKDPLQLQTRFKVELIPANMAFEFILMEIHKQACLIGDVGTTLLTAKWLRPELKSYAIISSASTFEQNMANLMKQHGVVVKPSLDEVKVEVDSLGGICNKE